MCYNYCTDLTLWAKFGFAKRLTGSCGWRSMLQSPPGGFVQESDQKCIRMNAEISAKSLDGLHGEYPKKMILEKAIYEKIGRWDPGTRMS